MTYHTLTSNIYWIIEKAREFQKNIYFCFIDYAKAFDCVDHTKVWKILKEMLAEQPEGTSIEIWVTGPRQRNSAKALRQGRA